MYYGLILFLNLQTRWGRVGERGSSAVLGSGSLHDAMREFNKKFREKSGLKWEDRSAEPKSGKYAYVERSYNPDSDDEEEDDTGAGADDEKKDVKPAECTLDKPTQDLMKLIFNQVSISLFSFGYLITCHKDLQLTQSRIISMPQCLPSITMQTNCHWASSARGQLPVVSKP